MNFKPMLDFEFEFFNKELSLLDETLQLAKFEDKDEKEYVLRLLENLHRRIAFMEKVSKEC